MDILTDPTINIVLENKTDHKIKVNPSWSIGREPNYDPMSDRLVKRGAVAVRFDIGQIRDYSSAKAITTVSRLLERDGLDPEDVTEKFDLLELEKP